MSRGDLEFLAGSGANLKILATPTPGSFDIEAGEYVGTLVGPSVRAIIQPKIPIDRFLFLLGYSRRSPRLGPEVLLGEEPDLLEAMQVLFARALDRATSAGLIHDYEEREDELGFLRGRLRTDLLLRRRMGLLPPVDCQFLDFTADTEVNRRLLAAARVLIRVRGTSGASSRLRGLLGRFSGVSHVQVDPRHLPPIALSRRYGRYGLASALADIVLRNSSVELRSGETLSVGFIISMEELFEDFVAEGLRESLSLSEGQWRRRPKGLRLDSQEKVVIRPDVVWYSSRHRPLLVMDVKYKTRGRASNDDLYQVLAYCISMGLRAGVLVYVSAAEETFVIRHSGISIHVLCVDPNGSPGEISDRLCTLGDRIADIAGVGSRSGLPRSAGSL